MNRANAQQSTGAELHREDWCTPDPIMQGVYHTFKCYQVGLDPCANEASPVMAQTKWYKDGLTRSWRGYGPVFGNFPYTRGLNGLGAWIRKFYEDFKDLYDAKPQEAADDEPSFFRIPEYQRRDSMVILVPSSTDTLWFHEYLCEVPRVTICFLKRRLKHVDPRTGKPGATAPFPSLLAHVGEGRDRFKDWFSRKGRIWTP